MTDNLRGIVTVVISSIAYVFNDAMVKLAASELPIGEIIVLRGILSTGLLAIGAIALGAWRPIRVLLTPGMILRLIAASGATCFIVFALSNLPLPTVTAVLQVTPLAVTAGSAFLYGERVGWRRWTAALTGFIGVLLVVRPTGTGFGSAGWIALTALIFTTVRDLSTRSIDRSIPSIYIATASSAAIGLAGFMLMPFEVWTAPSAHAWSLMSASAAFLFVGNTLIVYALRTGDLSVVAPFRYTVIPLSLVLGYLFWDDIPDVIAMFGILLVMGAGLYTLQRERRRMATVAASPAERTPAP